MAREEITIIYCDKCHCQIEIESTNEEKVNRKLYSLGWNVDGDDDICPDCNEDNDEGEDD